MMNRSIHLILIGLLLVCFSCRLHALPATSFFPANNATNVCADTPLKINFDAPPTIGTTGAVRIYSTNGNLVETLDLAVPHTRTIGSTLYNALLVPITGLRYWEYLSTDLTGTPLSVSLHFG